MSSAERRTLIDRSRDRMQELSHLRPAPTSKDVLRAVLKEHLGLRGGGWARPSDVIEGAGGYRALLGLSE